MDKAQSNTARMAAEIQTHGVKEYLALQQRKGLLRFLTCGSVDVARAL
jgi:sulfate adenylyltransferase subunit 1